MSDPAEREFEAGVHWINFIANLGLRVASAHGFCAGAPSSPDRSTLVVVKYEGGAVGALSYSWEIRSLLRGVRLSTIFGTGGSVTFESNGLFAVLRARRPRLVVPELRDLLGYRTMFRDFIERRAGTPSTTR